MDGIQDLINELPPELDDGSDTGTGHSVTTVTEDNQPAGGTPAADDEQEEELPVAGTDDDEETGAGDDDEEEAGDADPKNKTGKDDEEDDQSEYIVDTEEGDDDTPAAPAAGEAIDTSKVTQDEFVLAGLTKLTVQVVGPDDKIYTVQAYGNGDLPRDMKGFVSKYAEKQWDAQVNAQEAKARELIQQYNTAKTTNQAKADGERWVRVENMAIREDLNDLIREGIFPHFKGEPGSKEFEESAGGKEFDKVIKYMNERNQKYREAANAGKAYRHIGFREAYDMINGPNPKAAEKAEDKTRKTVARKLRSGGGTPSDKKTVSTQPVGKLTDLEDEFAAFIGSTK